MKITMEHGSGGGATAQLISSVFIKHFSNTVLGKMEDAAVVEGAARIAVTTDSFVVTPLFFNGGNIGKLAVCGTVNDLSMSGAVPKYLTCGFILETGADLDDLEKIATSMAEAAKEAGVQIIAGDTKVIEGNGGIYINTSGVGFVRHNALIGADNCKTGDVIILSGNLGDHHATILSHRMNINNTIASDCAPLNGMVAALLENGIRVKAMRDVTRGGLATVLNEFAVASGVCIEMDEIKIPLDNQVLYFCEMLGLDPLYLANEGKMIAVVAQEEAERALKYMKTNKYGKNAAIIGTITEAAPNTVLLHTAVGGVRIVPTLYGEGLPRIC